MMLEVKNISFSYTKEPFIEDISFNIDSGELVSLLGANGSGKSTLFSIMSGAIKPMRGAVLYNGQSVHAMEQRARAREIACIYQRTDCAFPFTCYEVAEMGLYPHKRRLNDGDRKFVLDIMDMTDTIAFRDKLICNLSGGEVQRVLLARALAQKPKLLLLDEAMSGFDIAVRLRMIALLRRLISETGMSVIFIRHDIETAFSDSDRIIALRGGAMLYNDKPKELLNKQFFSDIFNVKAEITDCGFRVMNIDGRG